MTLADVRIKIDKVDSEMKRLFIERMNLIDIIAEIKADSHDSIYKPEREAEIINRNSADIDEYVRSEYKAFTKKIIGLSRKYQYEKLISNCDPDFLEKIRSINDGKVKFSFKTPIDGRDIPRIMSLINDYEVNVTGFELAAVPEDTLIENVLVQIDYDSDNSKHMALLFQLKEETSDFMIV